MATKFKHKLLARHVGKSRSWTGNFSWTRWPVPHLASPAGNIIIHADSQMDGLAGALRAAEAVRHADGWVITPFPGGVCRSGSKVGSKYKNLVASTAETYCPTLRGQVATQLVDGACCAYEIVIDGVSKEAVAVAMQAAIEDAAGPGVLAIGAGNFGGRLGKHLFRLHDLFRQS